jgi:hypothetical protein
VILFCASKRGVRNLENYREYISFLERNVRPSAVGKAMRRNVEGSIIQTVALERGKEFAMSGTVDRTNHTRFDDTFFL